MAEYVYLCDSHARDLNTQTLMAARRIVDSRAAEMRVGSIKMSYERLDMVALAVSGTRCEKSPDVRALPYRSVKQWCSSTVFAYQKVLGRVEAVASKVPEQVEAQA